MTMSSALHLSAALVLVAPLAAQVSEATAFTVGNQTGTDDMTAIAYDASTDKHLVVWTVPTTGAMADLYGRFVTPTGALSIAPFVIDTAVDRFVRPSVASVAGADTFLIGYHRNLTGPFPTIADQRWLLRCVGTTGGVSNRVTVPWDTSTGTPTEIVVAGDAVDDSFIGLPETGLVVVRRGGSGTNNVACAAVNCNSPDPVLGPFTTLALQTDRVGDVNVTAYGPHGWFVVWGESTNSLPLYTSIRARVVDAFGSVCPVTHTVLSGTTTVHDPSIATRDLHESAVVWESGGDLVARTVDWTGTCAAGSFSNGPLVTVAVGGCASPSLTFARDKYFVAWRRTISGAPTGVYAKRLAPETCAVCSQEWLVEPSVNAQSWAAVSARWNGGETTSDAAIVVWSDDTIRGAWFSMAGNDVVVALGGGCAGPGNLATHQGECVLGTPNFRLQVTAPNVPVLALIVGFSAVSAPCGGCTIVPSPDILFPGNNPTTLAIPCDPLLVGVDLYTQWLLLKPSNCPILPDFSFTNALKFTIGE